MESAIVCLLAAITFLVLILIVQEIGDRKLVRLLFELEEIHYKNYGHYSDPKGQGKDTSLDP